MRTAAFSLVRLACAALVSCASSLTLSCSDSRCYSSADCEGGGLCTAQGRCEFECTSDTACAPGFSCQDHHCRAATGGATCPEEMVAVGTSYCIDRYEASRADATSSTAGNDGRAARSVAGVMPWQELDNARAEAACAASGKRLCTPAEWQSACKGPDGTTYAYGDTYDAKACNGIDALDAFRLMPTGSFERCTNSWGVYDLNGNLWEHVAGGSGRTVRGGAYNCGDSPTYHRCDYVPGNWQPVALGFRCCKDASPTAAPLGPAAGGADAGDAPDGSADAGLCLGFDGGDAGDGSSPADASGSGADAASAADDGGQNLPDAGSTDADASADAGGPGGGDAGDLWEDAGDASSGDGSWQSADAGPGDDAGEPPGLDAGPPGADAGGGGCPDDMVRGDGFCIDRFEASHQDATAILQGTSPAAASRAGVLPWWPVTFASAEAACAAAPTPGSPKRLCRAAEWVGACAGMEGRRYSYGDTYRADACNGIDLFCRCDAPACAGLASCPYPRCYSQASASEGGGPCGSDFHPLPTGTLASCQNPWGAFDLNGNVWEIVDHGDGLTHARGGAFNCGDSPALHQCAYDATWLPPVLGFRCCKDLQ